MSNYFLIENNTETGPYDLLLLIKKIRNGKLRPNDRVFVEGRPDAMLAMSLPELAPYFAEISLEPEAEEQSPKRADPYAPEPEPAKRTAPKDQARPAEPPRFASTAANDIDTRNRLKDAWVFFGDNQTISVTAGAVTLGAIAFNLVLSVLLPAFLSVMVACASAVCALYALIVFMYYRIEGEDVDQQKVRQVAVVRGADLAMAATLCSLPMGFSAALGTLIHPVLYLLMIPASVAVIYGVFAPLLMISNLNFRAFSALDYSRKWVQAHGKPAVMELAGILGLNLVAAMCLFVPFFISFPLSAIVFADIFRDRIAPSLPNTPGDAR